MTELNTQAEIRLPVWARSLDWDKMKLRRIVF
jgi:hypothetical protein